MSLRRASILGCCFSHQAQSSFWTRKLLSWLGCLSGAAILAAVAAAAEPVLKHSDVIFMYQADQATYEQYGATVLAWGGKPTPKALADAKGVKFFGSVGMVTEFGRYYDRFPKEYEEGLCRNIDGQPVKVPWLTDHQHHGVPFWWCCTQQPRFRQYLTERVVETIQAGANGLHIDDHMGTAGGLWLGLCFCDRCVTGFRPYLQTLGAEELSRLGVADPAAFDYRAVMKAWLAERAGRNPAQHPLWNEWSAYQCRAAAAFMEELRQLAARMAGHAVPVGANAGLLWPRHLADYRSLDLFSAETDHHAGEERCSDLPLFAYRMADAVGRPYAATASGGDWAYIKEHNLPGLVRGWIALGYAGGHSLMAPHRQWCYTPAKGTHWYAGPAERFAPLYQFVRREAALFDGFETFADVAIILPHASFLSQPKRWFDRAAQLSEKNISYRLLLGGDNIVDHPLPAAELEAARVFFIPERGRLLPADRRLLEERLGNRPVFQTVAEVLAGVRPAVQVLSEQPVRVLPRVQAGAAVIHLLNYQYEAKEDDVLALKQVRVRIDLKALGVAASSVCTLVAPDRERQSLELNDGVVEIPSLGLWSLLVLGKPGAP